MSDIRNPVRIVTRRITVPGRSITIDYPVVKGLSNPAAQHRINRDIFNEVNALIKKQGYYENPTLEEMIGWYEIKNNQRGILSLTIGNYAYFYHAAHGMTYIKGLTFDTADGTQYSLGDLFEPGSNYVEVLSGIVSGQIKERGITLLGEFKGIAPDQDFYIADKSLVLFFQLYDITPYAFGFPFFPVSVYEIQDIIKAGGPLDKMISGD